MPHLTTGSGFSVDMSVGGTFYDVDPGDVTYADSSTIIVSSPFSTIQTYSGSFTYTIIDGLAYLTGGTIQGFREDTLGGQKMWEITSLGLPVTTYNSYASNNDFAGLTVFALRNADLMQGAGLSDVLYGYAGNDTLQGFGGNDTYLYSAGDGSDTISDSSGSDVISYTGGAVLENVRRAGNDLVFDLLDGSTPRVAGHFSGTPVEQISDNGTVYNLLTGLTGGSGQDVIAGTDSAETLSGGGGSDGLYANGGDDVLDGGAANDLLEGGSGADTLTGGDGDDTVDGGPGDDLIVGGSGAGDDTYTGGDGVDEVTYESTTAGVTVDLAAGTTTGSEIGTDTLSGIENASGGSGNDTLTGDAGDNTLEGFGGDDTLIGGLGDDTYVYASGDDNDLIIDTGGASDVLSLDSIATLVGGARDGDDAVLDMAGGGSVRIQDQFATAVSVVEAVFAPDSPGLRLSSAFAGPAGGDLLLGTDSNNFFGAGAGDDLIVGGSGAGNDRLAGRAGADTLDGGDGGDTLSGGAGNDTVLGGAGNDALYGFDESAVPRSLADTGVFPEVAKLVAIGDLPSPGDGALGIVADDTSLGGFDVIAKLTYVGGTAGYANTVGVYTVAADDTIGPVSVAFQDAQALSPGDMANVAVPGSGSDFGRFLIVHGARLNSGYQGLDFETGTLSFVHDLDGAGERAAKITDSGTDLSLVFDDGETQTVLQGPVVHSTECGGATVLNADNTVHVAAGRLSAGNETTLRVGFEDLPGGGDSDFNDVIVDVEILPDMAPATDTLGGGAGNDTLTGGLGGDVFVFGAGGGTDRITDFEVGSDVFDLQDGVTIATIATVDADSDGFTDDTLVTLSDGAVELIGVTGITEADLLGA